MNGRFLQDRINSVRREYHDDALFIFISDCCFQFEPMMSSFALSPEELFVECRDICLDISGKGEDYIKDVDKLWPRLSTEYRRYDRIADKHEIEVAVTLVILTIIIALSTSEYDFYGDELPLKMFRDLIAKNHSFHEISGPLLEDEEKYHESLKGWFDKFFDEDTEEGKFKANYVAALALAMQAKSCYNFATRADFIIYAKANYTEFKEFSENNLLNAMNDLLQHNVSGDFTQMVKDQGSMTTYIEGCYTLTKRGKPTKACAEMKKKANEYFLNL